MLLTQELVEQLASQLAVHCHKTCFLLKQKDYKECYDDWGAYQLTNPEENFAMAVYPSYAAWAEQAFSTSNPETGINCLCIAQVLPSGDLAKIVVPLRRLQPGRVLHVNGRY